jgi:hypothetical protein
MILGRQLQAMRPPAESLGSSPNRQRMEDFLQDAVGTTAQEHPQKPPGHVDADQEMHGTGNKSPVNGYKTHTTPSDVDGSSFLSSNGSKRPKQHRSRSSFSFAPEKQTRGFSRFFTKGKE